MGRAAHLHLVNAADPIRRAGDGIVSSERFHAGSRAASSSPFPATKRFRPPPPPPAGEPFRVFVGSDPRENEAYEAHGFLSIPSLTINLEHHQQSGAHGISSLDDRPRQPAITIYGKYDSGVFDVQFMRGTSVQKVWQC
ncbi:hypothetical protein EJB05_43227, partial [Eragrostis curvula]